VTALVAGGCSLVTRSTIDAEGDPADGSSGEAAISETGRFLAFTSTATDLVDGDTNGADDIFRRDHQARRTELVSVGLDATPANGPSWSPALSADGRFVAFASAASNLVGDDTNGVPDVFVRDLDAGSTERVSRSAEGTELPFASGELDCQAPAPSTCADTRRSVAISGDGSQIAFVSSDASGPVVRWRDRTAETDTTAVVPEAPVGSTGSSFPDLAMSADGSTLAFTEVHATPAGDLAGLGVHHHTQGTRAWILDPDPTAPESERSPADACCSPDLSEDGRWLAFVTPVALVPEDDPLGAPRDVDVFVHDVTTAATERVSLADSGSELDAGAYGATLSDDAEQVTFWTADASVLGDGVGTTQLYLRDRVSHRTQRVSETPAGAANAPATGGLSGDGHIAVIATAATNLDRVGLGVGTPGVTDLYVRLATTPAPSGPAVPVTAGGVATPVVLDGAFMDATTDVEIEGLGVEVTDVAPAAGGLLTVTVTVEPGAALGVRRLWLIQEGPFGLSARTPCDCLAVSWSYPPSDPPPDRPSVLLVVTDDQRWDDVDAMPRVDARTDWARLSESFVNEPMCCPARATILTGRYSHHTGVETLQDGSDLDETVTVASLLDDAGYRTGFIGKYLNGYPFGGAPYVPPGWDSFAAYLGGTVYRDYTLFEDGQVVQHGSSPSDYSTDRFAAMAREFLRETPEDDPFFLVVAPNAPHHLTAGGLPQAAPRHRFGCPDFELELPPNFNGYDTESEPAWMTNASPVSSTLVRFQRVATCRTLLGVDEAVISLLGELEASGRLDDTYVIFTSDNGFSFGEHRLLGKGHLYEESVRVPLLVRGPDVVPGVLERLTSNVDLTPTILDWAGVEPPSGFLDGTSFADDLRGDDDIADPDALLLRGCRTGLALPQACGGHLQDMGMNWGLRTDRYKYVEYPNGDVQLFDLWLDPYELSNRADDPEYAAVRALLATRLSELTTP
jgi:N-acetylglucosamine-6-sulfatase